MPRLLSLCLIVVASAPAVASADECMLSSVGVGEVSGISVADPLVAVFGNESVDVELELRLGLRQVPSRFDSLGVDDEGGVLWCLSPDDSRCFPVDGPTEAPSLADPTPSSPAQDLPRVSASRDKEEQLANASDAGPSGITTRVERPPRR